MEVLPEVAVADADAATRAIYDSIMAHTGTGTPALIIRHFATFPGLLEWVWQGVGEELRTGDVLRHALDAIARSPGVALPPVGDASLDAAGLGPDDRALLAAILANYNRMNPMNFSLIAAIRALLAEPEAIGEPPAPLPPPEARRLAPCPALPPPVAVGDLPADLRQTLAALASAIPSPGAQMTPTLYRHLAIWPDLMRLLAPGIQAAIADGRVGAAMEELRAALAPLVAQVTGRARQRGLRPAPLADVPRMLRTLDTFLFAIPQMIVVGEAIEAAMPPTIPRWRG